MSDKKSKADKAKEKKIKLEKKLADKGGKMKGGAKAAAKIGVLLLTGFALAGCQSADPSSRSNRAAYRDIYATVNGSGNSVTVEVGDGLYASADGGGDKVKSSPVQTTDIKPEVAAAWAGGSAGTGGAKPSSGIVGEALNKLMGILGGDSTAKLTADEASAIKDCIDGNCSE